MTAFPDRRLDHAPIVRFTAVDSTQTIAFALAAEGAVDGTVVVADFQATGRGRRGRTWHAEPGTALLASILVRPRLEPRRVPLLSFAAAVAVATAVRRLAGAEARLKWPNDVMIRGKKVSGILLESRGALGSARGALGSARAALGSARAVDSDAPVVVVGIGLNLAQRGFPDEVGERATSLALETNLVVPRDHALDTVLEEFDRWRGVLERDGFGPVRERWLALTNTVGRRVRLDGIEGLAIDLDADGALIVDDGARHHRLVAGEITATAATPETRGHAARC
jgi:BirA family transcriptional regulator, biotin operon repressor / biotin---[acetyl-CoA-carboxylase] ligase